MKKIAFFLSFCCLSVACGTSIYQSVGSEKESKEAQREAGLLALDSRDFSKAVTVFSKMWTSEKTNDIARLYSLALVGKGGYSFLEILKSAMDGLGSSSEVGGTIFNTLSRFLPSGKTAEDLDYVAEGITILNAAPGRTSNGGITFQRCMTAAIYSTAVIIELTKSVSDLTTQLDAMPAKLSMTGTDCNADAATVESVGSELTQAIQAASKANSDFSMLSSLIGDCLSTDAQSSADSLTAKITKLTTAADKGCTIPDNQMIGSTPFPSCMNTYVASTAGSAQSGDNIISGCEVLVNCVGGTCF